MFDITLQDIISLYGQPINKIGDNYRYQCPYCNDTGRDNMLFNPDLKRNDGHIGFIKCFKDDSHSSDIMKDITKYKIDQGYRPVYNNYRPEVKKIIKNNRWLLRYLFISNDNLYNTPQALEYICKKWGLTKETILNYGIGINKRKKIWVLPIYHPIDGLRGFETRDGKLKSGKEKIVGRITLKDGSANCLAQINEKNSKTEILIIMEGYKDALTMFQYLKEKNQAEYYHVLTPSMGVSNTVKLLKDFPLSDYKKVILYLDTDEAGIKAMNQAKELFPFIEIKIMDCGCKDFNEHYLRCIKKGG